MELLMELMTIGAFADRTRLSPKALRLYNQLGLLSPAQVDPATGYRYYSEDQVESARLVGLLRRLDMPLVVITDILGRPSKQAAEAVGEYWASIESLTVERRALVSYIRATLTGADMPDYELQIRDIPERKLLTISRHLHSNETDAFFDEAFARLRAAAPGLEGIAGAPFLVFYGEISQDSDGPLELCRPVATEPDAGSVEATSDMQLRVEPAHDELFIRLPAKDMGWPALLPAVNALEAWVTDKRRRPSGPLRQVLIADQRTATPATLVCDLTVPLT
jgi:DNA-binding transcriptional MerR regulator